MVAKELTNRYSDSTKGIHEPCTLIYPTYAIHRRDGVRKHLIDEYMINSSVDRILSSITTEAAIDKTLKGYLKNLWRRNAVLPLARLNQRFVEASLRVVPSLGQEVFEQLCRDKPETFFANERDFLANREVLIVRYIEENCRDLSRLIMDQGYHTTYSHGYGSGAKGVYWSDPDSTDNECFFTSLMNGQTYRAIQGMFGRPIIKDYRDFVDPGFDVSSALPDGWDRNAVLESIYD